MFAYADWLRHPYIDRSQLQIRWKIRISCYFCTKTYLMGTYWICIIFAWKHILWVPIGTALFLHENIILWVPIGNVLLFFAWKHILWVPIGIALFLHENICCGYLLELHYFCMKTCCGYLLELHYFCMKTYLMGTYWKCIIFCMMKTYLVGLIGNALFFAWKRILWVLNPNEYPQDMFSCKNKKRN